MTTYRDGKLTPWYHVPKKRCAAHIKWQDRRCLNSASWEDLDGREVYLCKQHADMADIPMRLIRPQKVQLD